MSTQSPPPARALAPDLARGVMLLLIGLANIPWFIWGRPSGMTMAHPLDPTGVDAVIQFVMLVTIDMRALPMFAFLFGYGMVQFVNSRERRGFDRPQISGMLSRRHWGMLLFGLVHAALLFFGDVLGTYAILALVLGPLFFRRSDKVIRIARGVIFGLAVLFAVFSLASGIMLLLVPEAMASAGAFPMFDTKAPNAEPNYLASIGARLSTWLFPTLGSIFGGTVAVALMSGWLAARKGLLDRPQDHVRTLRVWAIGGIATGWIGGLPEALAQVGVLPIPVEISWMLIGVQQVTGLFAGLGYAALFGLIAVAISRRAERGIVVDAVEAVGQRSLSAYLFQSVCFAPLMCAWGFGLGGLIGTTAAAGIAILVWAVSVVLCWLLARAGKRGPAEVALRGLTYAGRQPQPRGHVV
ncbi:DUF418 domain-containing protein [Parenemella sanctibonifatiensis]|uniref:DUF418 domain-containing protein n=1 Tax=Parenemella sanctibonifatiensis TaxID=2016505 RepID=A0A255EPH6_9ACTN|nr:DUF418 domain-containing protein [Parenemella sanctibonifatiensis]OYN91362.1 hypothetical protein CGZ91_08010 [Parenemella sanctibonifatiensis]